MKSILPQKPKKPTQRSYSVYLLNCRDQSLYCGSTTDLKRRLHQHNNLKSGAHYTKIRRPVKLVYYESYPTFSAAKKREAEIKKLTRLDKIKLIGSP